MSQLQVRLPDNEAAVVSWLYNDSNNNDSGILGFNIYAGPDAAERLNSEIIPYSSSETHFIDSREFSDNEARVYTVKAVDQKLLKVLVTALPCPH